MSKSRVYLPVHVPRGRRLWRAALAIAAGGLLLLGSACVESSDIPPAGELEEPEPASATLDQEEAKPGADLWSENVLGREVTLIEGEWTRIDDRDGEPVSSSGGEGVPAWVTAKLESGSELPALNLTWPEDRATVTDSYVLFEGKATPGAEVVAGPFSATADAEGRWSMGLVVAGGENTATFSVTGEDGIGVTKTVTVYLESKDETFASKDPDWTKEAGDSSFQAWQKYGTCSEAVPYDVFKGKAAPGTTIIVSSPYGGGTAVAGADGYWKVKVTFETAPVGEPFAVTVSDGTETKTFSFTRTGADGYEQPASASFEVLWQKFGVSREAVAYEVFEGRAQPGTVVTANSPYGAAGTESNADGGWRIEIEFPGAPIGEPFEVMLRNGESVKVVTFKWKGPEVFEGFEVWQKSGTGTGPVPSDVFEGRAKAGSLITASSPYGSAETEANADGGWRIEIEFSGAPIGETFEVLVTDGTHAKTFTFIRKV